MNDVGTIVGRRERKGRERNGSSTVVRSMDMPARSTRHKHNSARRVQNARWGERVGYTVSRAISGRFT